jgi:hypothetical protein
MRRIIWAERRGILTQSHKDAKAAKFFGKEISFCPALRPSRLCDFAFIFYGDLFTAVLFH